MRKKIICTMLTLGLTFGLTFNVCAAEPLPEVPTITGTDTGTGTGSVTDTDTGSGTDTGAGSITDTDTGSGTDIGSGIDTGTGSGTDTGSSIDTGTGSGTDTGTVSGTETGSGTDTGTGSGTDTETGSGTDTGTGSGTDTETGSGTDTGTGSGTDTETGSGTDTGTGSGTDIDTGSGTDTETGSDTNTETGDGADDNTDTDDDTDKKGTVSGNDIGTVSQEKILDAGLEELLNQEMEVDPVVYSVAFPAITQFGFILDPYGLRALQEGMSASLEELKPYAGRVYCDDEFMVTNKSSVPVKLRVSIQLTGNVNAVQSIQELEADNNNNVLMYIMPSQYDMAGSLDNYQQTEMGIAIKSNEPTVIEFILPQSNYSYKEDAGGLMQYSIDDGENGHSTAFKIAGMVNRNADWSLFGSEGQNIGVEIKYSYEDASNLPVQYSEMNGPFALSYYDGAVVNVSDMHY